MNFGELYTLPSTTSTPPTNTDLCITYSVLPKSRFQKLKFWILRKKSERHSLKISLDRNYELWHIKQAAYRGWDCSDARLILKLCLTPLFIQHGINSIIIDDIQWLEWELDKNKKIYHINHNYIPNTIINEIMLSIQNAYLESSARKISDNLTQYNSLYDRLNQSESNKGIYIYDPNR